MISPLSIHSNRAAPRANEATANTLQVGESTIVRAVAALLRWNDDVRWRVAYRAVHLIQEVAGTGQGAQGATNPPVIDSAGRVRPCRAGWSSPTSWPNERDLWLGQWGLSGGMCLGNTAVVQLACTTPKAGAQHP